MSEIPFRVLPAAALAAAAGERPRVLAAPVVAVVSGPGDPSLADLLTPCVTLRFGLHPGLVNWLVAVGWSVEEGETRVVARPRRRVRSSGDVQLDVVRGVFSAPLLAGFVPGASPVVEERSLLRASVQLRVSPSRLEIRFRPELLRFEDLESRWSPGQLVVGASSWFPFEALRRSSLVVRASPANPARALSFPPASLRLPAPVMESAPDALARVEALHLFHPVALDPDVLDVASMVAAGPADRAGLLPFQDLAVSSLLASGRGALLASPPGTGKTVIVAAALAERAAGPVLVAAPSAVVGQWVEELRRWAPGLSVGVTGSSDAVTKTLGRCDVVVGSSQVVGAWALTSRRRVPLLVVDEAASLIRSSRTSRGLWRLREFVDAAWALSGSPDERGSRGGVGKLLAWSRGVTALPDLPADEFGPLLVGHWRPNGQEQGGGVPRLRSAALACPSRQRFDFAAPSKLSGLAAVNATESLRASLASDPARQAAAAEVIGEHAAQGGRTLVFANSSSALSSLVDRLSASGISARVLPSAADRVERVGVLSAFATGSVSVLAVTPASQRGVNLQQADLVMHLDLPASRSEMRQRSGRAVRIGSPHAEVTELLCALPGSVEEDAVRRLLDGAEPGFL
jgi:hypothetical protein